jgi:luciferase-like monooxygenase
MTAICDRIAAEVSAWTGVTVHPHRFGGVEFRVGRRELGHVHRNGLVDLPFPVRIREKLVAEGTAEPHHILPDSGWVSFHVRNDADVDRAVELFRLNYARRG